jgi:hypothetical protein
MQLAGRWLNQATLNPLVSGLGLGAATAGTATLGNIISGEADREGGGRLALEALGAGALGGALGAGIPSVRAIGRGIKKDIAREVKAKTGGAHRKQSFYDVDTGAGTSRSKEYQKVVDDANRQMGMVNPLQAGLTGIAGLTYGGLGGMIGGGVSNIGNMAGIGGLQQNTIVDPEAYGSSNLRVY